MAVILFYLFLVAQAVKYSDNYCFFLSIIGIVSFCVSLYDWHIAWETLGWVISEQVCYWNIVNIRIYSTKILSYWYSLESDNSAVFFVEVKIQKNEQVVCWFYPLLALFRCLTTWWIHWHEIVQMTCSYGIWQIRNWGTKSR